jgi:predicted metal-binding protein
MQCEGCAGKRRLVRIDVAEQNAGHDTRVVGVCKVQTRRGVPFIYANNRKIYLTFQ